MTDNHCRFIAKLDSDYVDTYRKTLGGTVDPNKWKTIPLHENLEWKVFVPKTLWSDVRDPRLVKVSEPLLSHVVFLLDSAVRTVLYWNTKEEVWKNYVLHDPGLGVLGCSEWDVWFDHQRGMYAWWDPITYALYTREGT